MSPQVIHTSNFVRDAADYIAQQARLAIGERGEFRLALSGGNTPRPVYTELAQNHALPWERVFITFGDERCVPPEDAQSNYRMARESLFLPGSIPDRSIARMRGEIEPQLGAQEYQDQLDVLAAQKGEQIYQHDLILLGMGDDGHTASLFPGTAALEETSRGVVANFVPKVNAWRLTFTFPLINHARQVCFLVDGKKHPELIDQVIKGDEQYPAARVHAASGGATWMIAQPS